MREILFRGKRIDNGKWVEGSLISNVFYRVREGKRIAIVYILSADDIDYDSWDDFDDDYGIYEVDPATVGQYTGLTDKNGKKIFEGDIVKLNTVSFETYAKITYSKGTFWIEKIKHDFINLPALPFISEALDYCVAGNIYDNPELLKGE